VDNLWVTSGELWVTGITLWTSRLDAAHRSNTPSWQGETMTAPQRPAFVRVRWREGYDIEEVDSFLSQVERGLAGRLPDPALAERIRNVVFSPVRLRLGYDMLQVDDYLDVLHA
jgi:DivIVA domain-containing protein